MDIYIEYEIFDIMWIENALINKELFACKWAITKVTNVFSVIIFMHVNLVTFIFLVLNFI